MKIKVNSLKMHELFPNDTEYNIIVQPLPNTDKNEMAKTLASLTLEDNINEDDIKYVKEIIQVVNYLNQTQPEEVLSDVMVQVNINDYYFNKELTQFSSRLDLSYESAYAYIKEKKIVLGTKLNNNFAVSTIQANTTIKEQIQSVILHETGHILDEINIQTLPLIPKNNLLDKLMIFLRDKNNIEPNQKNKDVKILLPSLLAEQISEMYADIMSVLLSDNPLELLNHTINSRQVESTLYQQQWEKKSFIEQYSSIMSDHYTLNALEHFKEKFMTYQNEYGNLSLLSLEKKDALTQEITRTGIMINLYFMMHVEDLSPTVQDLINKTTQTNLSIDEIKTQLESEINPVLSSQIKTYLQDEEIKTSNDKFKAVFEHKKWEYHKEWHLQNQNKKPLTEEGIRELKEKISKNRTEINSRFKNLDLNNMDKYTIKR